MKKTIDAMAVFEAVDRMVLAYLEAQDFEGWDEADVQEAMAGFHFIAKRTYSMANDVPMIVVNECVNSCLLFLDEQGAFDEPEPEPPKPVLRVVQ
jgi:hypothetical protein